MFEETWGLKPRVVYWIYTAVARHIVIYAVVVWWSKVKFETSKTELNKLQRMACLGITGAMRTTPTEAIEVLLGLPPLNQQFKVEDKEGIYRLDCNNQWKSKPECFGHAHMTWNMEREHILWIGD